jgi:hypothetical protein
MPAIPLGNFAYRRQANFQPEVELVNLFMEEDKSGASPDKFARIMRPGMALRTLVGTGIMRGLYRQSNFLAGDIFRVVGGALYRGSVNIGNISGSDRVAWAPSIDRLFVLGGGIIRHTDGATVETVEMPDDAAGVPVDIDTLNSYILITCSDGTIYWIVPGETEVDPLNFVTAESSPDGLVAGRRLESEMFFFGQSSTEPWQLTGDADAPFQKAIGRQYERGARDRDTVRRFDNSLLWVGDNGNVYRAGAQPEVICDEGISERIRKSGGATSAFVFDVDRHEFYALRIPGQGSFIFDASTRQWCRFRSAGIEEWAPHVAISDSAGVVFGSAFSADCWDMAPDSALDAGTPIEWRVTGNLAMLGRPQRNDSMAIGIGCEADCTIRVRWHDARDSLPDYYEELEARQPADMVNLYRMGSIEPPFRTFEVSGMDGVRVRLSGAATEAWQ